MAGIGKITYDRIDILLNMYKEKSKWLESIGKPMWNPAFLEKDAFFQKYPNPECFLAFIGNHPAGGFILIEKDEFFWNDDGSASSYYLHKLVVREGFTGKGLAEEMVMWARKYAMAMGKRTLRLECYHDREYLIKLYTKCGFRMTQIKVMSDGTEIALFEMPL